jgi:putative chitinase
MQDKISLLIPEHLRESFNLTSDRFEINTVFRALHFLSQIKHESGNFKFTEENLNYSADSLLKVFPKYFPEKSLALTYERKPIAIASRVYANRMGNGDEASRDGWTYRGRGFIQLTGKTNYGAFGEAIGQDFISNPDLIKTTYPMESAGYFWFKNKINLIADKGLTDDVIKTITKLVNGGTNGLQDRTENLNEYCKQLMINR